MTTINKTVNHDLYDRFYTDLNFDRAGLFKAIKEHYGSSSVLYPGCSIHITPSFYFQHVVYVDISDLANEYFNNQSRVLSVINGNKKYKQSAYVQFINHDYTKLLPIRENDYDLLVSIYAGAVTKSCHKYVRPGGIVVTNNHGGDALDMMKVGSFCLEAIIQKRGKKYFVEEKSSGQLQEILKRYNIPLNNMCNSSSGIGFEDKERYFIFRKLC